MTSELNQALQLSQLIDPDHTSVSKKTQRFFKSFRTVMGLRGGWKLAALQHMWPVFLDQLCSRGCVPVAL